MKITDKIKGFFTHFQDYIDAEKEIIKLKVIKKTGSLMGWVFSTIFIVMLFHIILALVGIWLGFWLSGILGSFTLGFGATVLFFIAMLILLIVFRKPLLIRPFVNMIIMALSEEDKPSKKDEQ